MASENVFDSDEVNFYSLLSAVGTMRYMAKSTFLLTNGTMHRKKQHRYVVEKDT